jgi:hypothetical protein
MVNLAMGMSALIDKTNQYYEKTKQSGRSYYIVYYLYHIAEVFLKALKEVLKWLGTDIGVFAHVRNCQAKHNHLGLSHTLAIS